MTSTNAAKILCAFNANLCIKAIRSTRQYRIYAGVHIPNRFGPDRKPRFPPKSAVKIPKSLFDSKKDSRSLASQMYQWQRLAALSAHDRTDRSASASNAAVSACGSPQDTCQYGTPDFRLSKSTSESALPTKTSGLPDPRHA